MTTAALRTPEQSLPQATKRIIFATLMCCVFLAMLDSQIVATALPTIMADLGDMEKYSWIGSAYLVTHSAVMPISGKLGDLFGRKYVLLTAVCLFVVGSLACGLASSVNWLIAARLLQGLGAGSIMVSVFAVNADIFEPRERARYQSFTSLVLLLSATVGPLLGGVMTQYWGWRSIFLVNFPIGVIAIGLLLAILPARRPNRQPRIDYVGAAMLTALVMLIVIWADSPQLFGGLFAWGGIAVLAAIVVLMACFGAVERRVAEPVLSLSILKHGTISRLLLISVGTGSIALGMANYHALYLQKTTGLQPAQAGAFFIALMVGISLGSLITGKWISSTGRYKLVMCIGLGGTGVVLGALALLPVGQSFWVLGGIFALLGLFNGLGQQVPTIAAQYYAPQGDVGAVTGAVSLFRIAGAAVATAVYGTVLNLQLPTAIEAAGPQAVAAAYGQAFTGLYGLAAGVILVCMLLAISLPKGRI